MPIRRHTCCRSTPRPTRPSRWALPITAGAGFLAGLDTTAVNLALPDIQRDLAAGLTELQWVVNAFALLSAALLVTAGDLSDRFGRRRVFVAGLLAFAGASAACGLSSSALMLDLARAAQGAAAAVVTASGLAVLASIYPPAERGRALGVSAAIAALSFVVGPLVGGMLTDAFGWRSVFLANVPVAALIAVAARATLPELRSRSRQAGRPRFDYAGVATFTLGFGALLYAALRSDDVGWATPGPHRRRGGDRWPRGVRRGRASHRRRHRGPSTSSAIERSAERSSRLLSEERRTSACSSTSASSCRRRRTTTPSTPVSSTCRRSCPS